MRNKPLCITLIIVGTLLLLAIIFVILYFTLIKSDNSDEWKDYETYVLSVFWPPESCASRPSDKKICYQKIKDIDAEKYFVIHGLWPSYYSNTHYLPKCNNDSEINVEIKEGELLSEMKRFQPGLWNEDNTFWNHEYNKHGYCYIKRIEKNPKKDYDIYFQKEMDLYFQLNYRELMTSILPDMTKGIYRVKKSKFENYLKYSKYRLENSSYNLFCNKDTGHLGEIKFFFDLNFEQLPVPKKQDECNDTFYLRFVDENSTSVYEKYDFYVMTIIWNPTVCKERGKECYDIIKHKEKNIFMIHGLWPSYTSGIIPQECNIDEDIVIDESKIEVIDNISDYWIGVYFGNNYFWSHEYNKHGYCYIQRTGKNPENNYNLYFDKTWEIYEDYNLKNKSKLITKGLYPGDNILNKSYVNNILNEEFGEGTYDLYCEKIENKNYLYEIRIHLDLNFAYLNGGKAGENCPDQFYLELIEYEGEQKQDYYIAENYDMYMFSVFWIATTCKVKGERCYEFNKKGEPNVLSIHGLWPNYKNKTLGDWCNGPNNIEINITNASMLDFMNKYWSSANHGNEYFWGHEYNKHGYCYNKRKNIDVLNYEVYFQKAIDIYNSYPFKELITNIIGDKLIIGDNEIRRYNTEQYLYENLNLTDQMYEIYCTLVNEKYYLSEIRISLELDFTPFELGVPAYSWDTICPEIFYAEFTN